MNAEDEPGFDLVIGGLVKKPMDEAKYKLLMDHTFSKITGTGNEIGQHYIFYLAKGQAKVGHVQLLTYKPAAKST